MQISLICTYGNVIHLGKEVQYLGVYDCDHVLDPPLQIACVSCLHSGPKGGKMIFFFKWKNYHVTNHYTISHHFTWTCFTTANFCIQLSVKSYTLVTLYIEFVVSREKAIIISEILFGIIIWKIKTVLIFYTTSLLVSFTQTQRVF